jgi:hypothetical protein
MGFARMNAALGQGGMRADHVGFADRRSGASTNRAIHEKRLAKACR